MQSKPHTKQGLVLGHGHSHRQRRAQVEVGSATSRWTQCSQFTQCQLTHTSLMHGRTATYFMRCLRRAGAPWRIAPASPNQVAYLQSLWKDCGVSVKDLLPPGAAGLSALNAGACCVCVCWCILSLVTAVLACLHDESLSLRMYCVGVQARSGRSSTCSPSRRHPRGSRHLLPAQGRGAPTQRPRHRCAQPSTACSST